MRLARLVLPLLCCLPLGGCPGFVIGYALGSWRTDGQDFFALRQEIESLTLDATEATTPGRRGRALERLRRLWLFPPVNERLRTKGGVQAELEARIPRLAEALDDADASVRARARRLLRAVAGDAVVVPDGDLAALETAHSRPGLDADEYPVVVPGVEALESAGPRVYALARLGRDPGETVPLLRVGLRSKALGARVFCALALHAVTGERREVEPILVGGLGSPHEQVRIAAAIGLGRIGSVDRRTLDALERVDRLPSAGLRRAAARARERIGGAGQ